MASTSLCGFARPVGILDCNAGRQQRVASGGPSAAEARRPAPVHVHLSSLGACSHRPRPVHLPRLASLPAYFHLGHSSNRLRSPPQHRCSTRSSCCRVRASAGIASPGEDQGLMGPFIIPTHGMAGGLGSFSGGATLERSKLDTKREVKTVEPRLDDAGGGGGIGKGLSNGGGGDDDGGDDDDYGNGFGEGGDDGEGDGFFRAVLQQLYNPEALKAVLTEFSMTMADLPAMLRQSVEMGLFSSAMLHTFLTTDVRPSITRAVTRSMPQRWARGIVGRLMADPAFMQKLLIEEAITVGSSLYWEARQRGRNFWQEADIVAANTLCLAGATGAAVWMLSPSRSHGTPHKWPWQNMLHNLPNHVFDASTPHRHFNLQTRLMGLATKAAELSLVGSIAGASMSLLNQGCVAAHRMVNPSFEPSAPMPALAASSSGLAATLGLCANARYQVIGGIDRYLFDRCSMLWVYLIFSGAVRLVSNRVGEPIRLHLQGLPTKFPERKRLQLTQEQAQLIQAYRQHQQRLQGQAAQQLTGQQSQQQPAKKRSSKKKASRGFQMSAGLQPAT